MSTKSSEGLAGVLRVFISSPTKEMKLYRDRAKEAIKDVGMTYVAYDDPEGIAHTQSDKTLINLGRDTVKTSDIFIGLYGFGSVWAPARDPVVGEELCRQHPELLKDPGKLMMEYEYEWAREANLYVFPFLRTGDTTDAPAVPIDARMEEFRRRLSATTVGWLTTPNTFYDKLVRGLKGIRPRVFLSYSRKQLGDARMLQRRLRNEDIHVWRDEVNIPGGAEWRRVIEASLTRMDALVVMITPDSLASEWVEKECKAFIKQKKTVVPFLADSSCRGKLPRYLAKLQFIDGTLEQGVNELARRLRAVLEP
jgi:TIR domain/Domain of unknown function (DUF4062)